MAVGAALSKRRLLDLDPDYTDGHIIETKRRCLAEEAGQGQAQQRVVELVVHELDGALAQKENEALQLQEQVQTCQRVLHVLRYGITSIYYKNLCSEASPSIPSSALEDQSNLHPAILRILGLSTSSLHGPKTRATYGKHLAEDNLDQEMPKDSLAQGSCDFLQPSDAEDNYCMIKPKVGETKEKTISEGKTEDEEEKSVEKLKDRAREPVHSKVPRYVPPIMPDPPTVCATSIRMERHRIKRRLVVGNISKWLPEDLRVGSASHKWMLYVRGPKDAPDISDIVSKVRYFLHPSYRPHDIAEVSHPFYLSRRGWGEFPVRVQVHFCAAGNRPIDIIHNLKLDRTYSGLQTLGGETVVDVWLKSVDLDPNVEECKIKTKQEEEEEENKPIPVVVTKKFSDGHHETVIHGEPQLTTAAVKHSSRVQGEEERCIKNQLQRAPCQSKIVLEAMKESCKKEKFIPSTVNGLVHHILPDHDYLGPDTFRLKCLPCAEQQGPDNGVCPKGQVKHLMNGETRCCQPTTLLPSSDPSIRSEQIQSVLQNIGHNAQGIVKVEESEETVRRSCEFRIKALESRNGIAPCTSLVQCVDAKGNVFYITLQKPSVTANDVPKEFSSKLDNVLDASLLQHVTVVGSNKDSYDEEEEEEEDYDDSDDSKVMGASNKINWGKVCVPAASLTVGRSLLKKNCLASSLSSSPLSPSSPVPSETVNVDNPIGFVGRKLVLGRLQAHSLKTEPAADPAAQLKDATYLVARMTDDRQVVTWLLQQLPLVDKEADFDPEFKKQHPYCAPSVDTFLSWPVGKRHSAERLRANAVYAILQTVNASRFMKWSVRHIMRWARLHALSPIPLGENHERQADPRVHSAIRSSVNLTVSEPTEVRDWLESISEASKAAEEMEDVDVEDLVVPSAESKTPASRNEPYKSTVHLMPSNAALCRFVQGTVEQLGIRLTAETLCPGVLYPAVEQLLFRACQCLCEDILRRSMHQAWRRCRQMPNEIVLADVQDSLLTRCEFDIFTNAGLGVQAYNTPDYM